MSEVKIVLNTDIKQAQQQVKRFEADLKRLQDLQSKGKKAGGFLDRKDVEAYKKVVTDLQRGYTKYTESAAHTVRRIQEESRKIEQLASQATNKQEKNIYERQLESLRRQKRMVEESITGANQTYSSANQTGGEVGRYKQTPDFLSIGKTALIIGVVTAGVSKLIGQFREGYQILADGEEKAGRLAVKTGELGSNFGKLRDQAENLGYQNAFTARETLATLSAYTSVAGVSSLQKSQKDVKAFQDFGRAYGIEPTAVAATIGGLSRRGVGNEGEARRVANLIAEAIKMQGMSGREEEFLRTTQNLADAVERTQVGLTAEGYANILNFQDFLVKANPALKGERGASIIEGMSSSISGGDNMMDVLLGKGSRYIGPEGVWALKQAKEKGISDPENLKAVMTNIDKYFSGAPASVKKLMVSQAFGDLPSEITEYLFKNKDMIKSGELKVTEAKLKEFEKKGEKEIEAKKSDYDASDVKKREQFEAQQERIAAAQGKFWDKISIPIKTIISGFDPSVGALLKIGGTLGGTALGAWGTAKLLPKATEAIGKRFARKTVQEGAEGATRRSVGTAIKEGAGKVLEATTKNVKKAAPVVGKTLSKYGTKLGSKLGSTAASKVPLIGALLDIAIDAEEIDNLYGSEFEFLVNQKMKKGLSREQAEKEVKKSWGSVDGSHASGIAVVPKDGYLARLHKNEAVLSAREATQWREYKRLLDYLSNSTVPTNKNLKSEVDVSGSTDPIEISIHISGEVKGLDDYGNKQLTSALVETFSPRNSSLMELLSNELTRRVG